MMPRYKTTPVASLAVVIAGLVSLSCPTSVRAGLVLTVLPSSAPIGGTGSFDVDLSNIGGSTAYDVSAFSVELSVSGASGVTFTGASTTTSAPYLFGTLQAPPLTFNSFPITDFVASDSSQTSPYFASLGVGATYGLENVTYAVASGTPSGPVTVSIMGINLTTQILDVNADLISFTPVNGTITIVPEPSSVWLLSSALVVAALTLFAGRRRFAAPGVTGTSY